MKDSRIGVYGAIGLVLLFALKIAILSVVLPVQINQYLVVFLILISGNSISRFLSSALIYWLPYARETDDSKSKPVAGSMSIASLIFSFLIAMLPFLLLAYFTFNYWIFLSLGPLVIAIYWLGKYFKKWIGGYTGDCLGAAQQMAESVFYFSIVAIWRFI